MPGSPSHIECNAPKVYIACFGYVLAGGVRTLAALGGGFLPVPLRGVATSELMHFADWHVTLSHLAGGWYRFSADAIHRCYI